MTSAKRDLPQLPGGNVGSLKEPVSKRDFSLGADGKEALKKKNHAYVAGTKVSTNGGLNMHICCGKAERTKVYFTWPAWRSS